MESVLFVGGGSIGHIAPSLAVFQELKKMRTVEARFVCGPRREEMDFLEKNGLVPVSLDAPRLSFAFPWKFWKAYRTAYALISEMRPGAVFSKGGYVSVPVCLAARRLSVPIVLHESDAVSGVANRLVSWWAERICLGYFPEGRAPGHALFTGNPVASALTEGSKEEGLAIAGLKGEKPVLLVLGGSQGSLALNEAVRASLPQLLQACDVIHITGKGKEFSVRAAGYWQTPFAYGELAHFYAAASVALSRAGAGAIAELAANGIPAILVPLRGVAHDHQEVNARSTEKAGACAVLEEKDLASSLVPSVRELLTPERRRSMSENIRSLHRPDAARQIAEVIASTLA